MICRVHLIALITSILVHIAINNPGKLTTCKGNTIEFDGIIPIKVPTVTNFALLEAARFLQFCLGSLTHKPKLLLSRNKKAIQV